ncbi:MAG: serine/threonine-protein phosphatase [Magnetococcales bacterium]|nr:serine/threonine-protein phosphatase [Magnetococcales bacterium]
MVVAGRSDVGCVRTLNEDNFCVDAGIGLLVVADGMGGHDAGEVASEQVIRIVQESLSKPVREPEDSPREVSPAQAAPGVTLDQDETPTLDDQRNPVIGLVYRAIHRANAEIHTTNWEKGYPEGAGMGSTVVGLWFPEFSEQAIVFHVGDSRLYLYSRNRLLQVTLDHSMYQQWLSYGGRGVAPSQNILMQAIGPALHVTPDIHFQDVEAGDVVMLCSDGLSGMVAESEIGRLLSMATEDNLDEISGSLVEAAKEAGGKDNITVIVGRFL